MRRILILEPNDGLRAELCRSVRASGYAVTPVSSHSEAARVLEASGFHAAVLDVSSQEDLSFVGEVSQMSSGPAVLATSANASIDLAVAAMKAGAHDFLRKPFGVEALELRLHALVRASRLAVANERGALLRADPLMQRLVREAEAAARSEATVQIVGESGTGKELLARHVHCHSARSHAPFVVVNCAALPESLAESELFGHERGAFTGAIGERVGQLKSADGGTLVLDEISEAAAAVQPKLLRVLQEREVLPVGACVPVPVDIRIIAITQRDLQAEVEAGRFREDLYYRLDVVTLRVPPLRERRGDIPLLANAFLDRISESGNAERPVLDECALAAISRLPLRGNARELENLMRRACVVSPGRSVDVDQLLAGGSAKDSGASQPFNLREIERRTIEGSLLQTGGNRTRASEMLGISVRTLRNKIRAYGLR